MAIFDEIKIIGFDENRPPRMRKESYIDLFYQLSGDAPEEWCDDFAGFGRQLNPIAKIDKSTRGFINTYINDIEAIPEHFAQLKEAVAECNAQFRDKLEQREIALAKDNENRLEQGDLQFRLNEIVASLEFDS